MPRKKSVRRTLKKSNVTLKNSININIKHPLGQAVRRGTVSGPKRSHNMLSGAQQRLMAPPLNFGAPQSRYLQATPNTATINYSQPFDSRISALDERTRESEKKIKDYRINIILFMQRLFM